jgi:hypothetical protein
MFQLPSHNPLSEFSFRPRYSPHDCKQHFIRQGNKEEPRGGLQPIKLNKRIMTISGWRKWKFRRVLYCVFSTILLVPQYRRIALQHHRALIKQYDLLILRTSGRRIGIQPQPFQRVIEHRLPNTDR